ncbi:hypothetical protein [Lysinibacillus sp. LZ02]|uniref:hypothetical protein n=1 Tax=Lysinibacillus sp. LZ02 TaxID=3420668 RepID=UPI003D363B2A
MTTQIKTIENALLELKAASLEANSDHEIRAIMEKYNLLFLGEKFNRIMSMDLTSTLKDYFSCEITHDELLKILPTTCKYLKMDLEELALARKPGELAGFFISL